MPNGSPFEREKVGQRIALSTDRVRETGLPLVYINQVGGQDELVFDGGSFVINADGQLVVRFPVWTEMTARHALEPIRGRMDAASRSALAPLPDEPGNTYQALMVGLRDYVNKNRFPGVLLGLSGGIDSALTAAIAVDALGPERVLGVRLPSRFTSDESQTDADVSARRLGMRLETIPIARRGRRRRAGARAALRRPAARHHRREHAGARSRPAADGGVEQVRLDAADDRQQVGDVGRLRDALRRHVRRLFGAEGPLQDRGVRAGRMAEPLRARGRARSRRARSSRRTS